MNFQSYQPQQPYDNYQRNNSRGNSFILRNSGQNILGNRNNNFNPPQTDFSKMYDSNPMAKQNFMNHQQKQVDFNQRQQQYNSNIINQSNDIRAQELNLRNIDRLNKINSEILRKQYIDQMNDVKNAQNNLHAPKSNGFRQNESQQSFHTAQNQQPISPPKRQIYSSGQPNYQEQQETQDKINQLLYQPNQYIPQPYIPQFNSYQQIPRNFEYPFYKRELEDYEDNIKPVKQIGTVIQKQNELMAQLINKLGQNNTAPPPNQFDYQKRQFDEYDRFMKLHQNLIDLKYQPQVQQVQNPQPDSNNNMMVQMMYQQQMMQALMYAQLLRNQDKNDANKQQQSVLDLLKQQRKEDNLERMIKQLIMQKGGNLEELQKKLDDLAGRQPQKAVKQKKPVIESDDEDDDDEDENDDDDEDDDDEEELDEAKKAELEKQRKAQLLKGAIQKVKKVWNMSRFAFLFLGNIRERENERRITAQQGLSQMLQTSIKEGLLWVLVAAEKGFSIIRQKPKDDLDIINNVTKLKSTQLESRIDNICNITQLIIEGLIENIDIIPDSISKYSAIFFQEKSYLPDGLISQFEIDRLEFNQTYGYIRNVNNEQKLMLTGVYLLIKVIINAALAHPWQFQQKDLKLKDDQITKTKLLIVCSILYHIFMEYIKKTINPIQNNTMNIPQKYKPQPLQQTLVHELGNKNQPENGTRYNIVTGLIDYNSLSTIWTQKGDWRNDMVEKIKLLLQKVVDNANLYDQQVEAMEKQEFIKQAQQDQLLLPPHIRKTNFAQQFNQVPPNNSNNTNQNNQNNNSTVDNNNQANS
ncbi:hypothetical protein TTHERM_00804770 (macronuclear) [Tetrahymena thermophila SB210]|uniref:Uncharacterized protein n=1 Tax=Tetrahymena thermophila (strain SB210) TaxID=312017 RepID=Q235C2_TETTS|nr:hypothetical protein TTHERM_00804770 [Tetrahymena thermophila SB210]EAR92181.2 hypothetical protein TTHERM_00804770 [Tetrahymena thermophila SB210]|eukprot:XP_001012426.2 hypothetical protein TTHERM_00804770 [Tetrahymena thermophila SB210]